MAAGSRLKLAQEPVLALAYAALLLAHARDCAEQAALAGKASLAVLAALLQASAP